MRLEPHFRPLWTQNGPIEASPNRPRRHPESTCLPIAFGEGRRLRLVHPIVPRHPQDRHEGQRRVEDCECEGLHHALAAGVPLSFRTNLTVIMCVSCGAYPHEEYTPEGDACQISEIRARKEQKRLFDSPTA